MGHCTTKRDYLAIHNIDTNPNTIAQFSPFWWNQTNIHGQNISYMINGTNCINLIHQGKKMFEPFCLPTMLAIQPDEERIVYDFGIAGGQFYMLKDKWYNANDAFIPGGECAIITPGSYSQQILGYTMATAMAGSTWQEARYTGLVQDLGTCLYTYGLIGTMIIQKFGIVADWFYSQMGNVPFGPNGTFLCANTEAQLTYDFLTLDFNIDHINAAFNVMPNTCVPNTTYNYCTILYSANITNNPCSQYNSVITIPL